MERSKNQIAFDAAFKHQQGGRLREAEQLYQKIIFRDPKHADALHNLAVISQQTGRSDAAIGFIRRTVALRPTQPEAHFNLGNILESLGKPDEAIEAYRRAVALRPNYGKALSNLGNALRAQGELDGAIAAYRQAIAANPNLGEVHYNLGIALKDQGRLDEAIAAYRRSIAVNPKFFDAHKNLGLALRDNGETEQAIEALRGAVALNPNVAEVHNLLGAALADRKLFEEAIASLRRAIALKPDYSDAHNHLGSALLQIGQIDEAIASCRRAIAIKSDQRGAHYNLGNALKDAGQLDEAIAAYRQAMALDPELPDVQSNLIFIMHYHPRCAGQEIADELRRWNERHAQPLRESIQPYTNDRSPERRLRVGYVSPDFRDHPVGRFLLPLLANHDAKAFEVFAYADVPDPDATTQVLRGYTHAWRSLVGVTHPRAAEMIREDGIDILVDLALHSADHRLMVFARKPAPVQVTYLAYAGSSGLTTMDYRLSDPYLDPPGCDESVYSERTVRLPETYWCYPPVLGIAPLRPRSENARSAEGGSIVFGCFNVFHKVNPALLSLWARVLTLVPHSRLMLHASEGSHRQRALEHLRSEGIDPGRVSFVARANVADYFERYQSIDIALDTFPFGGGTTSCDALWMGVPVVSLAGETAVGRGGLSILSNVGLSELVAKAPEEYVRLAVELANDRPRLNELHATLRPRMEASPLMDAPRFAKNIEAAYREMWRGWCGGTSG